MPERPDINRMIEEELAKGPKPEKRGDKPLTDKDIRPPTLEERLRAKAGEKPKAEEMPAPAELSAKKEEREASSLGKDYELLKKIGGGPAKEAFQAKLVAAALGASAEAGMTEELMDQHDVWTQLDTFLAGPASADKVIDKLSQKLKDRADAIRKRKETQKRYRGDKAA
jgi:hypothetical protein